MTARVLNGRDPSVRKTIEVNRAMEFMSSARTVLFNRLQPDVLQYGRNLVIGSCPLAILKQLMEIQGHYKSRTTKRNGYINGVKGKVEYLHFVFDDMMPNFGGQWHYRYYRKGATLFRVFYTRVAIIINTNDNRVYCNWKQATQFLGRNMQWYGM